MAMIFARQRMFREAINAADRADEYIRTRPFRVMKTQLLINRAKILVLAGEEEEGGTVQSMRRHAYAAWHDMG
ncbi:hypothetical protein [Rhizobium laguerreae]|uniref:hypothetical protein n=1 Tax=Rhizobium laguerreae TaxID=1076926 RepID=UPI00144156CE|nr:hypothetical protein [Rhizobium laguerreae]NKN08611.1 hypothetical protein [Rhizobium laguerreae]